MRSSAQNAKSKFRVTLYFFMNGYTVSYFENKRDINSWVNAMADKHGRVTSNKIEEL